MAQIKVHSRQELDINFITVFIGALVLTILIYVLFLPFKETYIGILLFERGLTQYVTVFFASLVIVITINKFLTITKETKILKKMGLPENLIFDDHKSLQLANLQEDFARTPTMITSRLSRILNAYILSGSRKIVTELALDDSSFYLSASESSYALPRILVWAIPLLGFIGTVLGISSAVNGFSGFLDNTAEIDQIKEGIGTVTSGLAVAFDTTLLALLLSVVVMIPLVLIEKMESELLLATEIYINDHILPRLKENNEQEKSILNSDTLIQTVTNAINNKLPSKEELIQPIKDALPTPQELINPVEIYAKEAAQNLVSEFIEQFQQIKVQETTLIDSIKEINQVILLDRDNFVNSFGQQNALNQSIITNIKELVDLVRENNQANDNSLHDRTQVISNELSKAALSLEEKVISLEKSSAKIGELHQLQSSLEKVVQVLNNIGEMQKTLVNMQDKIELLQPALQDLSKPRVIRLVEQIEQ
ncbi:MotA/TolQ/ExbB proton channel family protein [Geminocystis herdmanii]|uniref:MotA/TolQ/ExbB proton channel family protein n=1 Tax=Geminocystis herdmanii TaxID=669359 RepID=UPI00034D8C34|nr:MotA/TolQ/ExbB proton channel family protein [Geminocystis herdmanii]